MTQFSLSWDVQKNICSGLSSLQQNGEFVDMTLAADGHMVRVHQIILALASPYIKELISCANCPHPVIFLNRVSYKTLCSILEYVYTGEVLVSVENLNELIEAGRELHIKGIEDMSAHHTLASNAKEKPPEEDEEVCYFQIESTSTIENSTQDEETKMYGNQDFLQGSEGYKYSVPDKIIKSQDYTESGAEDTFEDTMQEDEDEGLMRVDSYTEKSDDGHVVKDPPRDKLIQYTVSNQGSVQMILNRFMYYVKHTNRDQVRQWRCVDYVNKCRCPAYVITKEDIVIKRISAHTHPFHDKRILKKLKAGAVFSAINEAERECTLNPNKKDKPATKQTEPGAGDSAHTA